MAEDTTRTVTIQISPYTMIAATLFVLGLIFLYSVREVLFIIFFAFILTSTLREPVRKLTERRVPKVLAILAIYLGIFLSFTLVLTLVAVPLARETIRFFDNLPELIENILSGLNRLGADLGLVTRNLDSDIVDENLGGWIDTIRSNLGNLVDIGRQGAAGAIELVSGIFGGLVKIFAIVVISAYMIVDHDNTISLILRQIPDLQLREKVKNLIENIEKHLGKWLSGILLSSLVSGVLSWAFLSVLGVQYALPLALFITLMTPLPYIGAVLSAIPAILVALASGNPVQIIGVPIAYLLVQQIESNIVTPRIMSNAIGLPPIIIIIAILIGSEIAGFAGVLLAVPTAAVVHLGMQFWADSYGNSQSAIASKPAPDIAGKKEKN